MIKRVLRAFKRRLVLQKIGHLPFGIVSNNCWGGHVYQLAGLSYSTPFVGLFLSPTAYLSLLTEWPRTIGARLEFKDKSSEGWIENLRQSKGLWPVGVLQGQVEIHFMHYKSKDEARSKWGRRLQRMPLEMDRLFLKFDDRDGCSVEQMESFACLPFPNKVLFTTNPQLAKFKCAVVIPSQEHSVPDGVALSRLSPNYFDAAAWVGGREQSSYHYFSFV